MGHFQHQSGGIASMCKNMYLLLVLGFLVAFTQARPQFKPSNSFGRPQFKPSSSPFGAGAGSKPSLGNLGGGWNLGKIPGGGAYGINYGKDNWKVGVGANGNFIPKSPYIKPNYGGVGFSYTFGKGK